MKQLLLVTAFLMSASARADVKPADVVLPFFDFVIDQIQDHNNNNKVDFVSDNVILQDQGNKIIFGQLVLDEDIGMDTMTLPKCAFGDNKPVTHIRLAVKKNDVTIDSIRVTFQNGKTQNIAVDADYSNGEKTEWFALKGLKDRCIQKVRVLGTPFHQWSDDNDGFHNPGPGGHIGFGNGGGIDIDIDFPGGGGHHPHPGPGNGNHKNSRSVLQVIGLKSI